MRKRWSSKWTFILATTGAAVGLGNIWKFPYVAGVNGGGAFVLIYLLCVLIVGLPLLIAELILGRHGRQNPVAALRSIALESGRSPHWNLLGALCTFSGFLILSYYSMIAGWALDYVVQTALGNLRHADASYISAHFSALVSNPYRLIFWHSIIIIITVYIVMSGIRDGLERYILYLFPSMLFILVLLVIFAAVATDTFIDSLVFLFRPNFNELTGHSILIALGHAFFTLSLALGTIITYGAYLPRDVSIPQASVAVAGADTMIALMAGMAIFPIVFAYGLEPGAGPGLLFQTLPISFSHIPYGTFFATLFFIMVVFAALATTISILEPTVSWMIEKFKLSRRHATITAGIIVWLLGLLSIFSFNIWSEYKLFDNNIFEIIDYLSANILLPLGGLLIAIFTGWFVKKELVLYELDIEKNIYYRLFHYALAYIVPIAIMLIFLSMIGII